MPIPKSSDQPTPSPDATRDPYRTVVLALSAATVLGAVFALTAALMLANLVLLDVTVSLGLAAGALVGVARAQGVRAFLARRAAVQDAVDLGAPPEPAEPSTEPASNSVAPRPGLASRALARLRASGPARSEKAGFVAGREIDQVRRSVALTGMAAVLLLFFTSLPAMTLRLGTATTGIFACFVATGLAAVAARYLSEIDSKRLPESIGLCQGARVVTWLLVLAAGSIGLTWLGTDAIVRWLHYTGLAVNGAVCYGLLTARQEDRTIYPLRLGVLSALGSRTNPLASLLDAGERQLGIDLRSTWALTVVRRGVEPLVIGLALIGWLLTGLTVVGTDEQGLVERLGVPVNGAPLAPGIHLHWPWPVDQVFRLAVRRVQSLTVGHEGQEEGGPENVLWAVEHAPNEYTLVLGNGRDLITVDAAVQFRIADARAWRYNCQNPVDALRAIAYRAVMKNTVNRTLADALSENVAVMTSTLRENVQHDADVLGLGVEVLAFTFGGMHPPVPVAPDYQQVVSAELGKVTTVVLAQAFRNQTLPSAETEALTAANKARADGAQALAQAAGEAWGFRALEAQYRAAPEEYFFRRRLEALEKNLQGRSYTIVDARIERDGGELWVIP